MININNKKQFIKPEFDKNVEVIPENLEYKKNSLKVTEGYELYIEAIPKIVEDKYLQINLVSFESNDVWFKIRVLDSNKRIIAESGIVRPGEYLEKLELSRNLFEGAKVTYKIMGYEKDSYFSAGSVNLNTRIGE